MKNAAAHAKSLRSLAAEVAEAHDAGADPRPQLDPLRALALGVLRQDSTDAAADAAMGVLDAEYVDFNELRVATELELVDLLGGAMGGRAADAAGRLKRALAAVFDAQGRLSLDRVAALPKREQRQALRKVRDAGGDDGMGDYAEAHVALLALEIATVPVDDATAGWLAGHDAADPEATAAEVRRFAEQNLKLDDCWPLYRAARAAAAFVETAPADPKKRRAKAKA